MFNKIKILLAAFILFPGLAQASNLEDAEAFKVQGESVRIFAEVALYKQGRLMKVREYQVYAGSEDRTLVLFKSAADAGQKVLMKGNSFWMFMPKSRRPIRITPMQKLLGEASLGDVATMSWSKAYEVVDERREGEELHLSLEARDNSASYQKIKLRLSAEDHFPLSADLYLRSGTLAKVATYERGVRDGKPAVVAMRLSDRIRANSSTLIRYLEVQSVKIPDKLFNPQILVRGDLETLLGGE